MRRLFLLLACLALPAAAADAPAPHAELASFADMLRLSAGAPLLAEPAGVQAPLRVTLARPLPPEPRFAVRAASDAERWLLIFSGLAAAGWVAHRRLVSAL
jgi:hypothetical protein